MPQSSSPTLSRAVPVAGLLALVAASTWLVRDDVFRAVAPAVAGSPTLSTVAANLASYGLLALVALAGALAVWAFLHDRSALWRLVCGGVGVIGAYALSETIKLLVTQERPCRVWDVATALVCPADGDWSWPSNHSVLAAAFATACILTLPRTAWFAIPAALVVGSSRVAAGVHYPHDVASGFALGVFVVALAVTLLSPMATRLPRLRTPELGDLHRTTHP